MRVSFDNSYTALPERMFARTVPAGAPDPALIRVNDALAMQLRLDPLWLSAPAGLKFLSGREIVEGSDPIAQAYAGHQFGHFVPQLGDGRAILREIGRGQRFNGRAGPVRRVSSLGNRARNSLA